MGWADKNTSTSSQGFNGELKLRYEIGFRLSSPKDRRLKIAVESSKQTIEITLHNHEIDELIKKLVDEGPTDPWIDKE